MLTKYDKLRLRKWANLLAYEMIGRGENLSPFTRAANAMIKDSYRLSLDIGGVTPAEIEKFFGSSEYR